MNSALIQSIIIYQVGDKAQNFNFNPQFSINDKNCDAFLFSYSVNTTANKQFDKSFIYNLTSFPSIINGITTAQDQLSVYTMNFSDSSYILNVTITAYLPDLTKSLSI